MLCLLLTPNIYSGQIDPCEARHFPRPHPRFDGSRNSWRRHACYVSVSPLQIDKIDSR